MENDPNSILEKKFARQELLYITVLTIIVLGAWVLSSGIFDSMYETLNRSKYCYGVITATIIITVVATKMINNIARFISKIWKSKKDR